MSNAKKGMPIWGWFLIGCAGLLVIMLIVLVVGGMFVAKKVQDVAEDFEANPEMAAAKMFVKLNPELEEVSVDEENGTITVREKKSGKEFTANFEDLAEGRFSITGEDGEVVITTEGGGEDGEFTITTGEGTLTIGGGEGRGDQPEWVVLPPGASVDGHFSMNSDTAVRGNLKVITDLSGDEVIEFYRSHMEAEGYEIQTSSFSGDGESVTVLSGQRGDDNRTLMVNVSHAEDEVTVALTYAQGE